MSGPAGGAGTGDEFGTEPELTRGQALDEICYLATVEHALCVDYLRIHYALGGDLEPEAGAGEPVERVFAAAQESMSMAMNEMRHLRRVNQALVLAGREPVLHRAAHILPASGPAIPLRAFSPGQFQRFPERERSIASNVDRRYARLQSAVVSPASPFEGELLDEVSFMLESTADHISPVAALADHLTGLKPAEYLRAARVEPADELERSLLALSNRHYGVLVATLAGSFEHDEQLGGQLLTVAVATMERLNDMNRLLVTRGLVPAFVV